MHLTPMIRLVPAVAALGLLGACGTQQAAAPAGDAARIADAVKGQTAGLIAAFNAHDAEKAVSYDAPDYVGMFHGFPNVVGPQADLAMTKQQAADTATKVTVSDEDVSVAKSGDRALYRATYAYTFTDPKTKQPTTEHGNWLIGWREQTDGSWKAAWSVVSDTGPGASVPAT